MPEIEVVFLKDYGCAYKKGDKCKLLVHVAKILRERGILRLASEKETNGKS